MASKPAVSTRVGDYPRGRHACGGWWVADLEGHHGLQRMFHDLDLNEVHRTHPALWKLDTSPEGFQWINADDVGSNTFSWPRFDGGWPCQQGGAFQASVEW